MRLQDIPIGRRFRVITTLERVAFDWIDLVEKKKIGLPRKGDVMTSPRHCIRVNPRARVIVHEYGTLSRHKHAHHLIVRDGKMWEIPVFLNIPTQS